MKEILTNQIIINWIAPIVTGLLVVAIPTFIIKIFRIKKDVRKVEEANQRYLDCIRPYIIQKINIDGKFIRNIRSVIIKESCIKEKYIYTEIELRNKIILDITEDNYINENDKKELSDFTYQVFTDFKEKTSKSKKDSFQFVPNVWTIIYLITFIISLSICLIIRFISGQTVSDMLKNDNFFIFSYIVLIFAGMMTLSSMIIGEFKSKVTYENQYKDRFINVIFERPTEKKIKKSKSEENKSKKINDSDKK